MQFHQLILFSSWTPKEEGTIQYRHVLHQERNGFFAYNRENLDGTGCYTFTKVEFEKVHNYFMKQVRADKKIYKNIQIFPAIESKSQSETHYGLAAAIAAVMPNIPLKLGELIVNQCDGMTNLEDLSTLFYEDFQKAFHEFYGNDYQDRVEEINELYQKVTGNDPRYEEYHPEDDEIKEVEQDD